MQVLNNGLTGNVGLDADFFLGISNGVINFDDVNSVLAQWLHVCLYFRTQRRDI